MRGSTPLDVAASSVMDNNGLALALEEPDLDKVMLSLCIIIHSVSAHWCVFTCIVLYLKSSRMK